MSASNLSLLLLALVTGALIPIQAQTNAGFSRAIGNPYITGLMVFVIGLLSMLIFVLLTRTALPPVENLKQAPLYSYLGGIIVPTYVVMITILVPRIGVGSAIGLIVTGQIICAVAIDHFGFFNAAVRSIDLRRAAGVLMMIGGIYLVMAKVKGNP
jgi:transporter family-2 protein